MDLKFSDLVNVVTEDATVMADKWATGISGRNQGAQQMNIVDMLRQNHLDQHPNKVKAPAGMPHSMQNLVQLLGDLYLQVTQVKTAIAIAGENPLLDERPRAQESLKGMIEKLDHIEETINAVAKDIDEFSIDPTKKERVKKKTASERKEHHKKLEKLEKSE